MVVETGFSRKIGQVALHHLNRHAGVLIATRTHQHAVEVLRVQHGVGVIVERDCGPDRGPDLATRE